MFFYRFFHTARNKGARNLKAYPERPAISFIIF